MNLAIAFQLPYVYPVPASKTFAMSNTELAPITVSQSASLSVPVDDPARMHQPTQDEEGDPSNGGRVEQELAPVDGGPAAWKLLCAAFVFEALLWGKPTSLMGLGA